MEAKEFVKKFGWDEAKARLNNNIDMFYLGWGFYSRDLKTLVDAWELVEKFGGLFHAKATLEKEGFTGGIELDDELIGDVVLKQAIELVESCND